MPAWEVVDFPTQGQQTNNYAEFWRIVGETAADQVRYLGVMVYGGRRRSAIVLVGKYGLLEDDSPLRDGVASQAVAT